MADICYQILNIESGEQKVLSGHLGDIVAVSYVSDGRTLVSSGSTDRTVRFWDTQTGYTISKLDLPGYAKDVSVSQDCKYVAIGCNKDCHIFHNEGKSLFTVLRGGHTANVYSVAFSPDSRQIATAGYDTRISIWKLGPSTELIRTLKGHKVRKKRARVIE